MSVDVPEDDVEVNLNIQSPGFVEPIVVGRGLLLTVLIVALAGGDIRRKNRERRSKRTLSGGRPLQGLNRLLGGATSAPHCARCATAIETNK